MHLTPVQNDTNEGDNEVQENSDKDESKESDDMLHEDSMQVILNMTLTRSRMCMPTMNISSPWICIPMS